MRPSRRKVPTYSQEIHNKYATKLDKLWKYIQEDAGSIPAASTHSQTNSTPMALVAVSRKPASVSGSAPRNSDLRDHLKGAGQASCGSRGTRKRDDIPLVGPRAKTQL